MKSKVRQPGLHHPLGIGAASVGLMLLGLPAPLSAQPSRSFPPLTQPDGAGAPARATAAPSPSGSRGLVRVFISADGSTSARLRASLTETLGRIAVQAEIVHSSEFSLTTLTRPDPGALARVWIDLRAPDEAQVLVVDGRSDRILTRKRVSRAHGDDLGLEQIALLVQTAVESSFDLPDDSERAQPRPTRVKAPSNPAADSSPVPRRPPSLRFALSPRYGVRQLSPDLGVTPGASLEAGVLWTRAAYTPGLWLTGSRQAATQRPSEDVELDVTVWSLGLMASARLVHSRHLDLELGIGARMYFWALNPRETGEAITPLEQLELDLTPSARLQAGHTLSTQIELVVALGLDLDLARRNYVYESPGRSQTLVRQAALRPMLELGFRFDVGRIEESSAQPQQKAAR